MRRLILGLVFACATLCTAALVVAAIASAQAAPATADQQQFEFKMGFKTLAGLIPNVVGAPVEDAHADAGGNVSQQTGRGMMVWRSADNWTGFTDGARTWVNGPLGLAVRGNSDRFVWEARPPLTFDDPFAYCAVVGTVDLPDNRYTGPAIADVARPSLVAAFTGSRPEAFNARNTSFRCFDSQLLACNVGANLNCGKAVVQTEPTPAMSKYCQDNPSSDFIPLFIVGHEGIYAWQCQSGAAAVARQTFRVDARGFIAEFWHQLLSLGGKGGGLALPF